MRKKCLLVTVGLGLSLILAVLLMAGGSSSPAVAAVGVEDVEAFNAPAAELHVCPSGCAYSSVQDAVDAAGNGDVIKVATGTYTDIHARNGVTQVVYIDETVAIQGGYTAADWTTPDPLANPTTLDAQGLGRVLYIQYGKNPTIEGLRITGGNAAAGGSSNWEPPYAGFMGGGVCAGPDTKFTLRNNQIFGNVADTGGGLCGGGDALIIGNVFRENTAAYRGGGLNIGGEDTVLTGNIIMSNTAGSPPSWIGGQGGGILIEGSNITLINNVIANNQINDGEFASGSGVYIAGTVRLLHNSIINNQGANGSGIDTGDFFGSWSSTVALTNTVVASQSIGIHIGGTAPMTVTVDGILWHSSPITVSVTNNSTVTLTVENQHTGDPAFAADGYHLTAGSAAINKGIDAGVLVDIDGQPRPAGAGYDLGADELWFRIYLPLVVRNW